MSSHIFNVACPRCDTAVKIFQGQTEYECSRCQFKVVIEDSGGWLEKFKNQEVEDLDFFETPIREPGSQMDSGIKISFSNPREDSEEPEEKESDDVEVDVDEFGNKTANTQIIQLTFDPAKYLDEMKDDEEKRPKTSRKISLKKVIKNAETAKPPVKPKNKALIRSLTIFVIACVMLAVFFLIFAE